MSGFLVLEDGTVIADVAAGGTTDSVGNTNTASTSTDHTVTYDHTSGGRIRHGSKIVRWRDEAGAKRCRGYDARALGLAHAVGSIDDAAN